MNSLRYPINEPNTKYETYFKEDMKNDKEQY